MKYIVTYKIPVDADELRHNTISSLPTEADLEEVIQNCTELEIGADLFDEPGFSKGWVKPNGDYQLT